MDGRMIFSLPAARHSASSEACSRNPLLHGQVDYLDDRENPGDPALRSATLRALSRACHTRIFDDYPKNLEGALDRRAFGSRCPNASLCDLLWKSKSLRLRTEPFKKRKGQSDW